MRFGYNSTIARKERPCKSCGKPCYPFSRGRCEQCSRIEDTMKRMEKATERMIEEEDLTTLIQDADKVVSLYIRLKHSDKDGMCRCYTCSTFLHYKKMQAGHYVRRGHLYLRWDTDRNIRPQCENCNCGKHGNLAVFGQNLEKEKPGITEILYEESTIVYKPTRDEIKQVVAEYSAKVKLLIIKNKS